MATLNFKSSSYPYSFVMSYKGEIPYKLYRFKSTRTNHVYLVRVEEYPYHFYGIKFYLKDHCHSKNKYNLLTGLNEPRSVINTCINILIDVYKKDKHASFGFIGAHTLKELDEKKSSGLERPTKRMRFYERIINSYFPSNGSFFQHYIDEAKNTYLIINTKELERDSDLVPKINKYFTENYSNFD